MAGSLFAGGTLYMTRCATIQKGAGGDGAVESRRLPAGALG
jgi:hypothetical protein